LEVPAELDLLWRAKDYIRPRGEWDNQETRSKIVVVDVNRIPSILLQTFLTVAEAGQISEAARRLHLSQPTVTGHIRRLEANLETTLFIRAANGVSLTERGAHLRERVQDVFAELDQILRELDRTREVNGTLTLAASTTVARYFVPRIYSLPSLLPGRRSSSGRW